MPTGFQQMSPTPQGTSGKCNQASMELTAPTVPKADSGFSRFARVSSDGLVLAPNKWLTLELEEFQCTQRLAYCNRRGDLLFYGMYIANQEASTKLPRLRTTLCHDVLFWASDWQSWKHVNWPEYGCFTLGNVVQSNVACSKWHLTNP